MRFQDVIMHFQSTKTKEPQRGKSVVVLVVRGTRTRPQNSRDVDQRKGKRIFCAGIAVPLRVGVRESRVEPAAFARVSWVQDAAEAHTP